MFDIFSKNKTTARLVDNRLVLDFADARNPVVWTQSLDHIGALKFNLKPEEQDWVLEYYTENGSDATRLAVFSDNMTAKRALSIASKALKNPKPLGGQKRITAPAIWSIALLGAVIFVGNAAFSAWKTVFQTPISLELPTTAAVPGPYGVPTPANIQAPVLSAPSQEPSEVVGAPVPADQLIQAPR